MRRALVSLDGVPATVHGNGDGIFVLAEPDSGVSARRQNLLQREVVDGDDGSGVALRIGRGCERGVRHIIVLLVDGRAAAAIAVVPVVPRLRAGRLNRCGEQTCSHRTAHGEFRPTHRHLRNDLCVGTGVRPRNVAIAPLPPVRFAGCVRREVAPPPAGAACTEDKPAVCDS